MLNDVQNVFLFVFGALMLAMVIELWGIAKALQRIADVVEQQNQLKGGQRTASSESASKS